MDDRQDERRMLADSVAAFTRGNDTIARARQLAEAGESFSDDTWREMADLGWLGILVPEEAGGLGLGVPEMAAVAEGLGRARAPEPLVAVAGLAAGVLAVGDRQSLCRELLEGLISGRRIPALAWQEDPVDASLGEPATRVEVTPEGTLLSGCKYLVTPAEADTYIVSTSTAEGVTLYRVAADAAGLGKAVTVQVDGSRVAELRFDRVAVGDADVIASPAVAYEALEHGLAQARVLAGAELLGLAESLLQTTIEYLGSRRQFDQPLSGFQVLRHRVVNLYIQTELMRAALRHATETAENGPGSAPLQRAASRVKARTSEAAMTVAREAVQLHGAIGYTEEADVGVYLHRVLVLSAWLGNAAWHRHRYAELSSDAEEAA